VKGRPSLTARHVAWQRAQLDRPATVTGDPEAEQRLEASLAAWYLAPTHAGVPMAGRTRFFDGEIQDAIDAGVGQIVILAAGYDGRALRFAHPGVRFFEVDHPATQADKRRRLAAVGAGVSAVAFVPVDLATDDLAAALAAAGFDGGRPALVLCEGLLSYLTPAQVEGLLGSVALLSAPGSILTCNFHVRPPSSAVRTRIARAAVDVLLGVIGEPRRCSFAPDEFEAVLLRSGWVFDRREEAEHEDTGYGVLVRAVRA
jgi:methyltransferase (TIGR00027 family)